MSWYIVDGDDYDPAAEDMYANARVRYGPFDTKGEAEEFAAEPGNKYFDEAHGPIVQRP